MAAATRPAKAAAKTEAAKADTAKPEETKPAAATETKPATKPKEESEESDDGEQEELIRHMEFKSLDDAILACMEQCPYVRKTGRVGQASSKYSYTFLSEVDLIAALHPLMVQHRLTLMPVGGERVYGELYPSKEGTMMNRVIIKMTYLLTHSVSGQDRNIVTFGEGTDSGDKATPKAMTIALKYAMRQIFNIEAGDDPDTSTPPPRANTGNGATNGAQSATQSAKPAAKPADPLLGNELGESFVRCRTAIEQSMTFDALEEFQKIYPYKEGRSWNYNQAQVDALEAAFVTRWKALGGTFE